MTLCVISLLQVSCFSSECPWFCSLEVLKFLYFSLVAIKCSIWAPLARKPNLIDKIVIFLWFYLQPWTSTQVSSIYLCSLSCFFKSSFLFWAALVLTFSFYPWFTLWQVKEVIPGFVNVKNWIQKSVSLLFDWFRTKIVSRFNFQILNGGTHELPWNTKISKHWACKFEHTLITFGAPETPYIMSCSVLLLKNTSVVCFDFGVFRNHNRCSDAPGFLVCFQRCEGLTKQNLRLQQHLEPMCVSLKIDEKSLLQYYQKANPVKLQYLPVKKTPSKLQVFFWVRRNGNRFI